jgi:ribosomal protein S18 acetylase RimI-like enzyme
MSHIRYSILKEKDFKGASECISSTFSSGEPMTKVLGIAKPDFDYFAETFIKKAIKDELSVVAKDSDGKVVGCIVCEDFITDLPEGIENISPNFNPIITLLSELDEKYKEEKNVQRGQLLHMFMGGVYKEFAGSGIAFGMTNFIEGYAKSKGFIGAVGEVTGPISQHVYIKQLGYTEISSINYSTFLFEGEKVFRNITECESCKLIVKQF